MVEERTLLMQKNFKFQFPDPNLIAFMFFRHPLPSFKKIQVPALNTNYTKIWQCIENKRMEMSLVKGNSRAPQPSFNLTFQGPNVLPKKKSRAPIFSPPLHPISDLNNDCSLNCFTLPMTNEIEWFRNYLSPEAFVCIWVICVTVNLNPFKNKQW